MITSDIKSKTRPNARPSRSSCKAELCQYYCREHPESVPSSGLCTYSPAALAQAIQEAGIRQQGLWSMVGGHGSGGSLRVGLGEGQQGVESGEGGKHST